MSREDPAEALCCLGVVNLPRLIPVMDQLEKVILNMGLRFARQKGSQLFLYQSLAYKTVVVIPERSEVPVSVKGYYRDSRRISRQGCSDY